MSKKSSNSVDNHNAARTGIRGEKLLKTNLNQWGFNLWKKQDDFPYPTKKQRQRECSSKVVFRSPYDQGTFECDGYIPELDAVIEIKYGTKHGTTEEKIFFDLEKIRDGVYEGRKLFYVFAGTPEHAANNGRCWAKVFAEKAARENLPVTVVFADLQEDGSMPGLKAALTAYLAR
jgi:hypothetical protein